MYLLDYIRAVVVFCPVNRSYIKGVKRKSLIVASAVAEEIREEIFIAV